MRLRPSLLATACLLAATVLVPLTVPGDVEPNDTFGQAEILSVTGTYSGVTGGGDVNDLYRITVTLTTGFGILVNVTPSTSDGFAEIYDAGQNWIDFDCCDTSLFVHSDPAPSPGTYSFYINISTFSLGPISYTFTVSTGLIDVLDPVIVREVTGLATTGDDWLVGAQVTDNVGVVSGEVQWAYRDDPFNWTFELLTDSGNGTWTTTIPLPNALRTITYWLWFADAFTNWAGLQGNATIRDNDLPELGQDLTPGTAPAGATLEFAQEPANDNIGIQQHEVEYWFDNGSHFSDVMVFRNGRLVRPIAIPLGPVEIHYMLSAVDTAGNRNSTEERIALATDTTKPVLGADYTPAVTTPGQPLTFLLVATDNVGLDKVIITYRFDSGAPVAAIATMTGSLATLAIPVPATARTVVYSARAIDEFRNEVTSTERTVQVRDERLPTIGQDATPGTAGTGTNLTVAVKVTDDIALDKVELRSWFGFGSATMVPMANTTGSDLFTLLVAIPAGSDAPFHYVVVATDVSGNVARSETRSVRVEDTINPTLVDLSDANATPGEDFHFLVEVADNIGIDVVRVQLAFGNGLPTTGIMAPEGGSRYSLTIAVPRTLAPLAYTITATDEAGRTVTTGQQGRNVTDLSVPDISDITGTTQVTQGETLTLRAFVRDNVAVDEVSVEYTVDSQTNGSIANLVDDGNGLYTTQITVPKGKVLHYEILATDSAGNERLGGSVDVQILSKAKKGGRGSPGFEIGVGLLAVLAALAVGLRPRERDW